MGKGGSPEELPLLLCKIIQMQPGLAYGNNLPYWALTATCIQYPASRCCANIIDLRQSAEDMTPRVFAAL